MAFRPGCKCGLRLYRLSSRPRTCSRAFPTRTYCLSRPGGRVRHDLGAQEVMTKFRTPASVMVGALGNVGQRCAEVTASARIVPASICEMYCRLTGSIGL